MLVLAAVVAVLARSGRFSSGGLRLAVDDTPACPAPVNRWADQRIALLRTQLQKEHNLYRNEVQAANGIGAMMTWVDDRIIDQHLAEERQRIRSSVLQSSRCLVEFQP